MFRLTDELPRYFTDKDKKIYMKLQFDNVLKCFEMYESDYDDATKIDVVANLLIEDYKKYNFEKRCLYVRYIIDNFVIEKARSTNNKKVFDFKHDASYIYASFYKDYGIDLYEEQGKLHWIKFISLFQGLSKDTKMSEVIKIRTMEIPKSNKTNAKYVQEIKKLKQTYALKSENNFDKGIINLFDVLKSRSKKVGE